jgi:hypothetical protein
MTKEELLKELDLMRDANVSEHALYENGYARGVSDATDAVNKYFVLADVSGSLAKQEALKEILEYIDSFHGSGHDFWWINSKVREKVYWMLERSKANDR